jgi:hypothetical protein
MKPANILAERRMHGSRARQHVQHRSNISGRCNQQYACSIQQCKMVMFAFASAEVGDTGLQHKTNHESPAAGVG